MTKKTYGLCLGGCGRRVPKGKLFCKGCKKKLPELLNKNGKEDK